MEPSRTSFDAMGNSGEFHCALIRRLIEALH
jgi:hypothetical protein